MKASSAPRVQPDTGACLLSLEETQVSSVARVSSGRHRWRVRVWVANTAEEPDRPLGFVVGSIDTRQSHARTVTSPYTPAASEPVPPQDLPVRCAGGQAVPESC